MGAFIEALCIFVYPPQGTQMSKNEKCKQYTKRQRDRQIRAINVTKKYNTNIITTHANKTSTEFITFQYFIMNQLWKSLNCLNRQ